ncbi:putative MutT family protein [Actinacidiphila reveromycinica]|uniref:Putative MutT family protein n=1 Tax=Actinacidiphila reveromycinica TaxID=659352 RepID=A0A7U3VSL0_9ACTN|nr:NUDIX domain-containing protein [Streptomyces sp. SN-593]BBB01935.1 putative MutT family protein [Streptomyces sp. SN-593]
MTGEESRYTLPVHVHVLVRSGDRVLLLRRSDQLPGGGRWQLPGGHLEEGESVPAAAARELAEETGLFVQEADLRFVHATHYRTSMGAGRLALFFLAGHCTGSVRNLEPDRCRETGFFAMDDLPSGLLPDTARALAAGGDAFSTAGWDPAPDPAPR